MTTMLSNTFMLSNMFSKALRRSVFILFLTFGLSACVSTIIGTTVDATIEVAKTPFKVGGAVIDVVTGDDD